MKDSAVVQQNMRAEPQSAVAGIVETLLLSRDEASEVSERLGEHVGALPLSLASRLCLRYCDSYTRMPFLLAVRPVMESDEWWVLLGQEWSGCDNIGMFTPALRTAMHEASQADFKQMMPPELWTAHERLPARLTVYRGCYQCNKDGLSWSMSKSVASSFPFLNRYFRPGEQPLLLTGTVDRSRAVLLLDRDEEEVISADVTVIRTECSPDLAETLDNGPNPLAKRIP